jgi:4-amino-4-deoxy-L-arabinose transferase-like glycosyltransferase
MWDKFGIKSELTLIIIISIIAFFVRLFYLSAQGLTIDELAWIGRGHYFAEHWEYAVKTPWSFVGGALNLPAAFLIGLSMKLLPFLDKIAAARFPIAVLGALTCIFLIFFVRREYSFTVAIISGILLALDPVHIGLSRISGIDASLTFFMMLGLLLFYESERKNSIILASISGVFFALSFLTKVNALTIIFILFAYLLTMLLIWKEDESIINSIRSKLRILLISASIAGLTMYLAWPAMWSNPYHAIRSHLSSNLRNALQNQSIEYVASGGKLSDYYLELLPIRLPEITLIPLIIGFGYVGHKIIRRKFSKFELFLLYWVLIFLFIMSFFPKHLEIRYILPIWPPLLIFSALGLNCIIKYVRKSAIKLGVKYRRFIKPALSVGIIIILTLSFPLLSFFPNYYLYYNSIAGGPEGAKRFTVVGWGEGHREAALFIAEKAGEDDVIAVFGYPRLVRYYFPSGEIVSWRYWREADYLIVYNNFLQRATKGEIAQYISNKEPLHTVKLSGCNIAWVYKIE